MCFRRFRWIPFAVSAFCVGAFTAFDGDNAVISEFMASNGSTLVDEDEDYSDWIEIHNPTEGAIDLSGWSLTDDASEPRKWTFTDVSLGRGGYLVVFASGKDRQPGAGHWNSVVQRGDLFRYLPGTEPVADEWNTLDFDDGTWDEGPSSLGYERGGGADIQTEVEDNLMSLYTRIEFTVDDPADVRHALLHVDYDDGFIAYVNGREVARGFMTVEEPSFDTPASGLHEAVLYQGGTPERFTIDDPQDLLQAGSNVLAVEVHNDNPGSSDLTLIPFLSLETGSVPEDARGVAPELGTLEGSEYHTNFSLDGDGEYLALVNPDGEAVTEYDPYPNQRGDVSYGVAHGGATYFTSPTPGAPNATGTGGFVDAPTLSAEHGIYEDPFSLFLFPETDGSVVRYTLDGSQPTDSTGKAYIGPIRIEETTVIRAAGFKEGAQRSDVVTRTYLFLDDVIRQSADGRAPKNWPTFWGGNAVDYGMDPQVVDGRESELIDALREVPTFSLVMELDSLFGASRGIYANALSYGRAWERPASIELIYPRDFPSESGPTAYHGPRGGFQINAGVRIRGGWSRNEENPKHAFRIFFRGEYGPTMLSYPLFGDEGVDEYDKFDLRTSQNYSWAFYGDARNTMLRDVFSRDIQRDMGVPYTRSRYYHLYLNGQYWGLFQTQERADHWHGASYDGGDADDYDVVKSAGLDEGYTMEMTAGSVDAWRDLYDGANQVAAAPTAERRDALYFRLQGLNPDGTPNPDYPVLLDPDNLIQYMLVIFWTGNPDAPITPFMGTNNFFGYRDRTGDRGFTWFAHDSEHTLLPENGGYHDRTGPFPAGDQFQFSNPQWIHQQLMGSKEYRLRFADLAHEHLFGDGLLTTGPSVGRWDARAEEVEPVMLPESARWGDSKTEQPRTVEDWRREVERVRKDVLPPRRNVIVDQLMRTRRYAGGDSGNETIEAPLFPTVDPPIFNHDGGEVESGFALSMEAPVDGTIYYTLDGSDPRRIGGSVSDAAAAYDGDAVPLSGRALIRARLLSDAGEWSALDEAEFFVDTSAPSSPPLVVSEVYYNPVEPTDAEVAAGFDNHNDFEFIELYNPSPSAVTLSGLAFTDGIKFTFPDRVLAADARTVVVSNVDAFRVRFGDAADIAGAYESGRLSNGGERLTLSDRSGTNVFSVNYGDGGEWPARADGLGSSLVLVDGAVDVDRADSWRASVVYEGSPGMAALPPDPDVVVNEVLSHTDPPLVDAVELYNTSDETVDLSGWLLSDGPDFRKYAVPSGTTIEPGGYVVFDESDFNASGTENDFAFDSAHGDEVWVVSADKDGRPVRFVDYISFGATRNGESVGRAPNGRFAPLQEPTLGRANSAPRVGPVVLREIMYHPPGNNPNLEYIGIRNEGGESVDLTAWTLREGVDFVFPDDLQLAGGDSLFVVAFDPSVEPEKASTFRKAYGWNDGVLLVGGWDGRLANDGEVIELNRPDEPPTDEPDFIPETLEERAAYDDAGPWPAAADGDGASLYRTDAASFSDDAASWRAASRPFILYEDHQEPDPPEVFGSDYVLSAIYPNPARERAQAMLTVGETQHVRVTLYDMLGREVRTLYDGTVREETIEPLLVDGAGLASGVYLLRIAGRDFTTTRSVTFVR